MRWLAMCDSPCCCQLQSWQQNPLSGHLKQHRSSSLLQRIGSGKLSARHLLAARLLLYLRTDHQGNIHRQQVLKPRQEQRSLCCSTPAPAARQGWGPTGMLSRSSSGIADGLCGSGSASPWPPETNTKAHGLNCHTVPIRAAALTRVPWCVPQRCISDACVCLSVPLASC